MKLLVAAVFVLFCTKVLCSYAQERTYSPATCCFSFISRQIPRKYVVGYFETGGQCLQNGIIFLTKKGQQICANPKNAWVQEYISDIEKNH
ncbi:C-C motif chemokine 3-like [Erinaceus europaeus]|uniref:C-C motif chemokine n=1 Tax=Erinaceus europaeus TaxID=9365 RepID=A0ABM3YFT2_ERIEU|nr:C-C motif chemokine 3-like [Erinaceus europaeus]